MDDTYVYLSPLKLNDIRQAKAIPSFNENHLPHFALDKNQ